ncbi:MAG: hypothetical protein OEY10_00225 [Nitrosopumilus sp.]|nr:hypothetical protein [Nitrosopumilus sp.]
MTGDVIFETGYNKALNDIRDKIIYEAYQLSSNGENVCCDMALTKIIEAIDENLTHNETAQNP